MKTTNAFRSSQAGFTLVELVVVMVILGILAATALPKFMNVNSQAHESAVAGTGGAFGSAVALAHAQWIANGHTGEEDNLAGFGDADVDTNANGWPVSTDGTNTDPSNTRCVQIWDGIMQNPPSAATSGADIDYIAAASSSVCTFTYQGAAGLSITYDVSTGAVSVNGV